jgi:hypothetical protein
VGECFELGCGFPLQKSVPIHFGEGFDLFFEKSVDFV